jgi:hypothetical protein
VVLQPLPDPLPEVLMVRPWVDPVVEANGFEPRSLYVEICWLPVLGPSATWLYRRLGQLVRLDGMQQAEVDMVDLSISMGLGRGTAKNSLLARTLFRLTRLEVARWRGNQFAVRRALAPLSQAQLRQLSLTPRSVHNSLMAPPPEAA